MTNQPLFGGAGVKPYFTDEQATLYLGDALTALQSLPDASINCCVTSPPYFGLRSYLPDGVVLRDDLTDDERAYVLGELDRLGRYAVIFSKSQIPEHLHRYFRPAELGAEKSPAEYVAALVAVFAEVRRVLANDGTLWLSLGDSYSTTQGQPAEWRAGEYLTARKGKVAPARNHNGTTCDRPAKNLLGIPWRVALALQDDDSGDTYEMLADAPLAAYNEICLIRTRKHAGSTTASTHGSGGPSILSDTASGDKHGTRPTPKSCAATAGSTTNSTGSKRSSETCAGTRADTGGSDSTHSSDTAEPSQSAPAAASGASPSSHSTTSAAAEALIGENSTREASTSGSSCAARTTRTATESSVTTATARSGITASARTKKSEPLRLQKAEIPPELLQYFRLVKQDRWILRNDIIWAKPNGMPESVTDRLSTKHEHLFLFAKSRRYWFDLDPIREEAATADRDGARRSYAHGSASSMNGGEHQVMSGPFAGLPLNPKGRNPGDVWTIPTQPFTEAHFAVFPVEIPRRAIAAGCKPGGVVLDPFSGSGTTGLAAAELGRRYVGIDLNRDYLELSLRTRLSQPSLTAEVGS